MKDPLITTSKIKSLIWWVSTFFNFSGFYIVLVILIAVGFQNESRLITVPLRALVAVCLLCIFLLSRKRQIIFRNISFYVFCCVYICRLFYDIINSKLLNYYISGGEIFLFFFFFTIFPFIVITKVKLISRDYNAILNALLVSSFIFSIISFVLYNKYIGQVGILATSTTGDDVISHISLSYCSILGIAISGIYLLTNRVTLKFKLYLFTIIVFLMIAFIIASGRGAAVALIVAFAFYFIAQRNFSKKIKTFLVLLLFCGILYWLLNALGSTLLDRFSNINYSSDNYGDQDIRILMWRQGLRQFISHPLFGSGIQLIGYSGYPHNIFVEILYTTGILGFIPFVVLIYNSFRAAFSIFRHYSSYSWIGILFIIGFMEHIFSGAVYTGGWLWFSIALLFAVQTNLQNQMFFKRKSLRRFY